MCVPIPVRDTQKKEYNKRLKVLSRMLDNVIIITSTNNNVTYENVIVLIIIIFSLLVRRDIPGCLYICKIRIKVKISSIIKLTFSSTT